MELFKKTFLRLLVLFILGWIYCCVVVGYCGFGIRGFIYFGIIFALVWIVYNFVNKKTKILTKRKNKIILIVSTVIASILFFGAIFGTVDYIMTKNGNEPIFSVRGIGYSKDEFFLEDDNTSYSGLRFGATEYYGLGYKLVVCDSCDKSVYFMPFGLGTYAWFISMPVDKLNGQWFHANNNDIYMFFDGVGHYSLYLGGKVAEEGTYKVEYDSVVLTPLNVNKVGNCTIKNDYHELHCDKYAEVFMR